MVLCNKCKEQMAPVIRKFKDNEKTKKAEAVAYTYECPKCKGRETLNEEENTFACGLEKGYSEGTIAAATKSLNLKFTEDEFLALFIMFWFSGMMQGMRTQIFDLQKEVETLKCSKK